MATKIATNKKAYHNYFLSQTWECGIALKGSEVKSVRAGHVSFSDSFARVDGGEVMLYNLHINPYEEASFLNEEPDRVRKLLLHKHEIRKIVGLVQQRGFLLVPTKIYFNARGLAKVEIALAKSKKLYDKRDEVKKRDLARGLKKAINFRKH
jgi:SsrA-binding protein